MNDPADPGATFERVTGPWTQVIDDMHTTAEGYRAEGWRVVECHPGDVATLTGEPRTAAELSGDADPTDRRLGLDIVVGGDEFAEVRSVLADREPETVEVFSATGKGLTFLLFVVICDDAAVFVPAYFDHQDRDALRTVATDGGLPVHVRPLTDDERVTFTVDDPELCFPE